MGRSSNMWDVPVFCGILNLGPSKGPSKKHATIQCPVVYDVPIYVGLGFTGRNYTTSSIRSRLPPCDLQKPMNKDNIGALIIRVGFWGPLYYSYNNKEPPKIV